MSEEIQAAGSHPAVVVSMAAAGIAVAVCALVAIAYFLGWLPASRTPVPATAPAAVPATKSATPTQQSATTQSGVVLLPGETLVAPPDPIPAPAPVAPATSRPGPTPPQYAKPTPPATPALRAPPPAVARESPRPPPQFSREERRPNSYDRSTRSVCLNCAIVTSIQRGDYDWEVRVRFDDGSRDTLRYYDRPRLQVGDAVHLEEGRLVPD